MIDCCILFLYHRDNEVTRHHLRTIQKYNPDIPIAHLSDGIGGRWDVRDPWRNIDAEVYNWYEGHKTVEAERYIILEWDCLCTISIREFYKDVWDCDLAVSEIRKMGDGWYWFREYDRVEPLTPCGAVPFAGSLISNRLLDKISRGPVFQNAFCELRLGSLAVGYNAKIGLTPGGDKFLSAVVKEIGDCSEPGVYHSVKSL